ncbi:MAG TPA: acetyl-CoA carboxylase biotin carboxylase subunit [Acholeplasmataceae bacterium]|nr:acetyl-CoA carboxylase biotin carboxylase subunit [Acholeplasmataceae bacterium]
MRKQNKILIANRGEIAVRIIRACKELGIPCVAVYSTADKESLHVKLADEAICIGGPRGGDSYLNINNIISSAIATGCNSIHPGYGFLAENDKFIELLERCNLTFIGPGSETVRNLGDKVLAKQIAKSVGIPVIEGSDGAVESLEEAQKVASKIGFPLLIKATAGGGGKGISIIYNHDELIKMFELTKMEAEANFGNSDVYLEKYIEKPHHIEVQFLVDHFGNSIYFPERDCSIQRRNQKMIEESPSPFVTEALRKELGEAAIRLAKASGYTNAGTVEFIVDEEKNYYFLEVNTRIQVEHPLTEAITGVDLVKEQIRIAYNDELALKQEELFLSGHALECRITAEDPNKNFMPAPGLVKNLVMPGGPGVRIDTHLYNDYEIPAHYDSLLAKLIVWAPTRKEAIRKMRVALEQFIIDGIKSNIEILYLIMHNTNYVRGYYDTGFIKVFWETLKGEF